MAYILGFFAADGYITVNNRGGQFWCFQIADKKLLLQMKRVIGSDHKISVRKNSNKNQRISKKSILYRLQIGSIEMCDDLRRLGFSERKTKNLSIPRVPKKYFPHFVRGYFDGDGSVWVGYVHKERSTALLAIRTVFTSGSKRFLYTLQQKLEEIGINNGVLSSHKGAYYRLTYSIHGSLKLYAFMYNHRAYVSNPLFLERKKKIFDRYIHMRV